jgi:DNA-binding GntR family transcriptional regulator
MTEILSSEIGVSRTPIREALHRLKADGLVAIRAHLGASVTKMGVEDFKELCDMRLALEGHAAGLAAINHNQLELGEIKYALEEMRKFTALIIESEEEGNLIDDLVREDVHFHIAIMSAAKNKMMKSEILRLHLVNRVVFGPTSAEATRNKSKDFQDNNRRKVLEMHEDIFAAILEHNAQAAKVAMERHIQDIIDKSLRDMALFSGRPSLRKLTEEELTYRG